MADNYLERKYQEYQSQKSSATKSGYGKKNNSNPQNAQSFRDRRC